VSRAARAPPRGGARRATRRPHRRYNRPRGRGDLSPIRVAWLALVAVLAAACAASVKPNVALPHVELGSAAFFPTLEAYAGTAIAGGNRVDVLLNGDEIFPAQLAAIRAATATITFAQYYWEDGQVARETAEALAERCRAGVGVKVLLDAFGALGIPYEQQSLLQTSGCDVAFFRPLTHALIGRYNNRDHRRILVVDGRIGFTGGAGTSDKWMGDGATDGHWRDTDVRVEGPVVRYLQTAFAETWLDTTGVVLGGEPYFPASLPRAGDVAAHTVTSSPAKGDFAMYTTLLLALSAARRSIFITNPYFVPDERMTEVLLDAVARGVRIVVLVPGQIDHNLVRQASRAGFGRLLLAGVEIYEYAAALLHAKTMVIDGIWSTIGSTNLDNRSFALNAELNLIVYDRIVAERLERVFVDDLSHARRIRYAEWKSRPLYQRLLELLVLPIRDQL
jgi:cardiolipin synthase